MSNGDMDLSNLKNVSKTMLVNLESRGRLHMQPLSDFARKAVEELLTEYISNYPSSQRKQKRISEREQRLLDLTLTILNHYSDEDLAHLDKTGVEIIGIRAVDHLYNDFDTSWGD